MEPALHPVCIRAVQLTVIAADKALQGVFIRELLLGLGFMFQPFITPFNNVRSVDALPDRFWKMIKRKQAPVILVKNTVQS